MAHPFIDCATANGLMYWGGGTRAPSTRMEIFMAYREVLLVTTAIANSKSEIIPCRISAKLL